MRKDNVVLLLYGNVGSGKTYVACSIANAIITEYSYTVKMRNFARILNEVVKDNELTRELMEKYIDSVLCEGSIVQKIIWK